ncbi:hypothetical protein BaRGS_00037650 [Batillaria attramentaria]|uniref:Uncharacterized protein n=1 Tax=Batillaria attramentaria TaxID=370345 RepID=A0ABD0J820_9CAEN
MALKRAPGCHCILRSSQSSSAPRWLLPQQKNLRRTEFQRLNFNLTTELPRTGSHQFSSPLCARLVPEKAMGSDPACTNLRVSPGFYCICAGCSVFKCLFCRINFIRQLKLTRPLITRRSSATNILLCTADV